MTRQDKRGAKAADQPAASDPDARAAALTEIATILGMAARRFLDESIDPSGADALRSVRQSPSEVAHSEPGPSKHTSQRP
jgi:hypothetical protein